ncbi:M3 family oligoendopeptidase [Paenibacillus thermoaerophilus]|uniref:M3 family oligoendopeptidase n=1 Tax=Paenibacillus thermoaerophilus TaxID=1215385 RepID=A0ABW2V4M0_9BACL|nr:M3 family oligoendopeptidase [Paenibacillus thermoaerophilus]TMV18507.1 M3 family oligoendopeptidase [Paenibacillus thermoaerophilus]
MKKPLPQVWDLDVLFQGGSGSREFAEFLDRLERDLETLRSQNEKVGEADSEEALAETVVLLQDVLKRLREADSFTACLAAENQQDKKAVQLAGRVKTLLAAFEAAMTRFDVRLASLDEEEWNRLRQREPFRGGAFVLDERRKLSREKLGPELESLLTDLAVDGYHGWGENYNTIVSKIKIPFRNDNGETEWLSAGQAHNRLHHPDRKVRARMFESWESAWGEAADYCADALNRLAGFRLQTYKHRGWQSVHKEPLAINRMSPETLRVMWETIDRSKPVFVEYLQRKAKLFGLEKLSWHDVEAPIGTAGKTYSYDEAAELIMEQFRRFSPDMASFAERCFEDGWIEAEDRAGKRPGGFCTSFPVKEQTRIFMTYAGTASNVSTLAHELGHAYHQHVMNNLPALAQEYAMNVAETASTFAEMIVADATLKQAADPQERVALLEDKIQRSVAFFMNIHARFIFETNFYEERRKGFVGTERLNELMVDAQREAFRDALGEYHPHFWASKLHFYITEVPFYNFPYTFGYLFSSGIYAEAQRSGPAFADRYIALLRDTASMTVEDLAKKHLGVDLTKPDFWQSAVELAVRDVREFLRLTV